MKYAALILVALLTLSVSAQEQKKSSEEDQIKAQICAEIDNLDPQIKQQIQEAKMAMEKILGMKAEGQDDEVDAEMAKLQEQSQKRVQECLADLPEATRAKVEKAIQEIKSSSEQRQVQFKESK